jgi:hypothetical protein
MATGSITLRNTSYDVTYNYEYDPSVGIDGVGEWDFENLSQQEIEALNLTELEEEDIINQLNLMGNEYDESPDDCM